MATSDMAFPSLADATLEQLSEGLQTRLFTSVQLTKAYLARIDEVNGQFRAATQVNPDVLDIAAELDQERAEGIIRGPLHGIPVLVKNNIATADKMHNTAGSSLLIGATVSRDAFTIHKLRTAGAIILGKANLSQWAYYRSRNTPSDGWSSHGGQTLAAHHPAQSPSGSSSGSAVAVDLGLAWAALGTETDGSILLPAQRSGVVGIKPTVGRTSRDLVVPISERQDTVGTMGRTVRDAACLLGVVAGKDERDNYTMRVPAGEEAVDYVVACKDGLAGAKIGVPWRAINAALQDDPHLGAEVAIFKEALSVLKSAGVTLVEANFASAKNDLSALEHVVLQADFPINLAAYLSQLTSNPHDIHTLADIRAKTQVHPDEDFPQRNTSVWDEILDEQGWDNTDARSQPINEQLQDLGGKGGLFGALEQHGGLDALVMPTSFAPKWAAVVGAPAVTVPMGRYPVETPVKMTGKGGADLVETGPGVPIGMSFLGGRWMEERLVGLAYGFEARMKGREGMRAEEGEWRVGVMPRAEVKDFVCEETGM